MIFQTLPGVVCCMISTLNVYILRFFSHCYLSCFAETIKQNDQAVEEDGVPWALLYNLGTALLQRNEGVDVTTAEECLSRAEESCRQVK